MNYSFFFDTINLGGIVILGSHVGFKADQLLGSVKEAITYDATTFMCYTGAPQNSLRKPIDISLTKRAWDLMAKNNIDIKNVVCHAPYIVNLANKEKNWDFTINFIKDELKRCDELHINKMVLHPGNAVGMERDVAINNIIDALNHILEDLSKCKILIETMAGKGTEVGCTLDEIKTIIDGVQNKDRIGVCLDTCHLNDSGVDIIKFDDYLNEFDKLIGIDYIGCVHVNDSKNELGSKKDRHANIGMGTIGFDALYKVVHNPLLKSVPKILETPYILEYPPYKQEIEMLVNNKEYDNLEEEVISYYK